jgi:GAF domain-containing protein
MLALVGTHVDVTERKRAEALLSGEKRLLEMIATGIPLKQILNALCLIIEEQRSDTLASVLLMKADGVHLNVIAAPNLPNEWIQQMEKLPIGPCAGSCGTAAFHGSPVIVSDIATDPLWDVPQHRAAALHHGLQASWSNPVVSPSGKVLGTFCIYHREPHSPNEQDFELIELATHIARVAIERDRAEEALRTSEQLARSHVEVMMRSLDVLATEAAPEKFVAEMLRTIGQRLRASSVSLWLRNQQDESLRLQLVIENDQEIAPHSDHPFVKNPKASKGNPYFQEMFFTKGPVVCEDVAHDPRIGKDFREYLIKRGRKRFMAIPMFVLGEVRGFIGIQHVEGGTYRPEEIELAQALAHHVMMAAHGAELAEQRRHAVVPVERTRMARDIHDTLAQGFTGVIVQLEAAEDALGHGSRKEAEKHLQRAGAVARRSLSEARRSVHALRPQALWEHNFWDALKDTIKNTTVGTALHTTFEAQGKIPELPQSWQENLLRIG